MEFETSQHPPRVWISHNIHSKFNWPRTNFALPWKQAAIPTPK